MPPKKSLTIILKQKDLNLINFHSSGFTLIELCIVILIVGLLTSALLSFSYGINEKRKKDSTDKEMLQIVDALEVFYSKNNYLPCPSPIAPALDSTNIKYTSVDCNLEDFEIQQNNPLIISKYSVGEEEKAVYLGNLPVKQLNLNPSFYHDAWGTAYVYTVSKNYISNQHQANDPGAVEILLDGQSILTPESSAIFSLISYGENGFTGCQQELIKHEKCYGVKSCEEQYIEYENCNNDHIFNLSDISNAENNYFNDVILYKTYIKNDDKIESCNVNDLLQDIEFFAKESFPPSVPTNNFVKVCPNGNCQIYVCDESGYFLKSFHSIN